MQQARACARCHRLKVKCEQAENKSECTRCSLAGVSCEGRPSLPPTRDPHKRSKSARSVEELARLVRTLSESVATLKEQQESRHSSIWKTLNDKYRRELFTFYATKMAPGWPIIRMRNGLVSKTIRECRPLFYRGACVVAMLRVGAENSVAAFKESYKYFCDVKLSDEQTSIDLLETFFLVVLYVPFMQLEDGYKILSMATNLCHQTLSELEQLDNPSHQCLDPLELHRCRCIVYLMCNSSRIWQFNGCRVFTWGPVFENAVNALQDADSCEQALVECVVGMRISEGISALSMAHSATEEVFRQYLSVYSAQFAHSTNSKPDFASLAPALFRIMQVMCLIEAYLDLFANGDDGVNVPLVFEALVHEGQGLVDFYSAIRDSGLQMPSFFYLRPLKAVLTIAYYCRAWGMPYFSDLIVQLTLIFETLVATSPSLLSVQSALKGIETWHFSMDVEDVLPPTLNKLAEKLLSSVLPLESPTS